jgi:hypothetical protein
MKVITENTPYGERGYLIEHDAGLIVPSQNNSFITEVKRQIKEKSFDFTNPVVYAVMQKHGVENKNGRIYTKEILEREMLKYLELIKIGASAGCSDHEETAVISIQNTSMRVTNLWWEGRTMMGEIYLPITKGYIEQGVISHPADKICHDMLHGFQYGVSSRGVGSLKEIQGHNIVQDDFEIICWDFVTTPSTHGSYIFANKNSTAPYVEGLDLSPYEKSLTEKSQKKSNSNVFDNFTRQKPTVDDALSRFMSKFK